MNLLHTVWNKIWNKGKIAQDFKEAAIIPIYKNKSDCAHCTNHRGINLFCTAGKVFLLKS